VTELTFLADISSVSDRQNRPDDPWDRIAARLDEALGESRDIAQSRLAPSTRGVEKLLDLLAGARREVQARELEAKVTATRAQRLEAELAQQRRRADILVRVGKAINAVREVPALLQLVVDLAVDATAAERGLVIVPDPLGGKNDYSATTNLDAAILNKPEFAVNRSIVERVFRQGQALVTTDARSEQPETPQDVRPLHIRSIICVPIRSKEGVIGVIYVDSRVNPDTLLSHDPELLATIADQAAVAIDNARLYDDLSRSFRELSAVKAQNDEVLESIASGVMVFDDQDVITQFNRAAELTFGLSASTVVGRNARILNTWLPGFTSLLEQHRSDPSARMQVEVPGHHFVRGPFVLQVTFFPLRGSSASAGSTAAVINDLTESRALEAENQAQQAKSLRIARSFERYLAPHVVSSLMKDPDAVVLGGTRQTATMLFADIRGFTDLSERLLPEEVVELLNRYLGSLVNVVFANGGLLDKFYGDGVMAVFGAPRAGDDDALHAATTAVQILEQISQLNAAPGVAGPLAVSVGLATGDVVAGHIGSERRLEYTVIGDAVNLASRLQAIAQPNQILCDERTYERIQGRMSATRRMARIKGKAGLTPVFAISG